MLYVTQDSEWLVFILLFKFLKKKKDTFLNPLPDHVHYNIKNRSKHIN